MSIGLSPGTATWLAWVLLAGASLAGVAIAFAPAPTDAVARRVAMRLLAVTLVALCLRAAMSLLFDGGTYDIFFAYRKLGNQLRLGGDVYGAALPTLANYPPVIYWWWSLVATIVPSGSPHLFAALVRAPFWIVDAAIAPVLALLVRGRWRWRSSWLYAVNPIAIAVPTLHGQFDSIPALCLLLAVAWLTSHPRRAAWLVGVGAAVKVWPAYFVPALLTGVRRAQWAGFIARVMLPALAAFAVYFVIHPDHIVQGIVGVIAYVPHRQGLGTSLLFPASWGDPFIAPAEIVVAALLLWMIVQCARRGVAVVDIVALSMLIVLALLPAISDQYLMWPMAILLLGGHRRIAALLAVAMTPATLAIDITSASQHAVVPAALPLLATAATIVAAAVLWRETWMRSPEVPAPATTHTDVIGASGAA
jgi:Glycosyltransferase family 87